MVRLKIFFFLCLFISFQVRAYENICEHDGNSWSQICEWKNFETDTFKISKNSFPTSSTQYNDLTESFDAWEDIVGAPINVRYTSSSNSDGVFTTGDGVSEVGFVSSDSLYDLGSSNGIGVAVPVFGWNISYGYFLKEVDILFSSDTDWEFGLPSYLATRSYPNPAASESCPDDDEYMGSIFENPTFFRMMAVHEIGHSLGLWHITDYGWMLPYHSKNWAHPGSNPFMPLPDDRQGLRAYYPGSSSETDMGLSNYRDGGDNFVDNEGDVCYYLGLVCPGDTFEATKTTLNNGTSKKTMDAEYYLSKNDTISRSDILVKTSEITVSAEHDYTSTKDLTVPSTVEYDTKYYAGLIIDPLNTVSETSGYNNTMILGYVDIDDEEACSPKRSSTRSSTATKVTYKLIPIDYITKLKKVSGVYEIKVNTITPKRASDGKAIYSYIDTTVLKTFFGSTPPQGFLNIRQIGGTIGNEQEGEGLFISEVPQLKVEDHLIVFLGANEKAMVPFVGGESGVLKVMEDPIHGSIVTTYGGLPFVGYDSETHLFSIRPDYLKEAQDQQTENKETDKEGNSIVVKRDLSILKTPPLTLAKFAESLSDLIQTTGPYTPIQYEKSKPTSVLKEATDFSKINEADQAAKAKMEANGLSSRVIEEGDHAFDTE